MLKFATCLNCIDGRTHEPVILWIKEKYNIDYIDMITEPGMDGLLSKGLAGSIVDKVAFSVKAHETEIIFIVGHHDCLGNPVDDNNHIEDIKFAARNLKSLFPNCQISGLWLTKSRTVEEVSIEK